MNYEALSSALIICIFFPLMLWLGWRLLEDYHNSDHYKNRKMEIEKKQMEEYRKLKYHFKNIK